MAEMYVVSAMKQKMVVFSPIVYCHPLAEKFTLPGDATYWKYFNNHMMRKAEAVHVLHLMGWRESKGVQYEIMMAEELGINIIPVEFSSEELPPGVSL